MDTREKFDMAEKFKPSFKHKRFLMRVKLLREGQGHPQTRVADDLEMNRSSYADLETGMKRVDIDKVYKLADYFEVTVGFLLNGERGDLTEIQAKRVRDIFDRNL